MKPTKVVFVLLIFLSYNSLSFAQEKTKDNAILNLQIFSKSLQSERNIRISLPENYKNKKKKYPVVYLMDGQLYLHHVVSLRKTFQQFKVTPEFIIVGIETPFPQRYRTFRNQRENLIQFVSEELTSYMKQNFRTNENNIFFGWQYAGAIGFDMLKSNSPSFSSYLLASPYPIKHKVDDLPLQSLSDKLLYFSVSPDEYEVNHGTDKLDSLLVHTSNVKIPWAYVKFENEEHHSTPFPTLYHGLKKCFEYYKEFQMDNLSKFLKAGGLEYAREYSKKRGEQYGGSTELSDWSKYTIIRSAIRDDNYPYFEKFMKEFATEEFIVAMKNRSFDFTSFYEKKENYKKSIVIYEQLLNANPKSKRLLTKLAKAYELKGDEKSSKKYTALANSIKE